jgi:hypothetical protein
VLAVSAFAVMLIRTAFIISAVLSQLGRGDGLKNDSSLSYFIMSRY